MMMSRSHHGRFLTSRQNGSRGFGTVVQMGVYILGVNVMGVDVLGVDVLALICVELPKKY